MNKSRDKRIIDLIYSAHRYLQALESTPRDYGTGDLLFASEIHTVVAVGKAPGCNLTELAAKLDVSKAAVSKFVAKLLEKGYLVKGKRADNDRVVIFHLTPKGQAAVKGHQAYEKRTFGPLLEVEAALCDRDYQTIYDYFDRLTKRIRK